MQPFGHLDKNAQTTRNEANNELKAESCIEIEVPYNLYEYLNSTDSALQNICRICLSHNECTVSLLTTFDEENQLNLIDMLYSFTSLDISPDANVPVQICIECKGEVISCYNFKTKCDKSNFTLQTLLKGQFIPSDEVIDCKSSFLNDETEETSLNEGIDIQYLDDTSDHESLYIVPGLVIEKEELPINEIVCRREKELNYNDQMKSFQRSKCGICSEKFKDRKSLENHIKQNHSAKKTVSHPCGQCKEMFNSEHDRQLHLTVHTTGPKWTCKKCSKEFKARSMLRRHIQRHMESKRFTCDTCGKSFAEFYALRRHSRVHTGETVEKKHVCHICSNRYSENKQLSAHLARHNSERPFVCAVCGKSFVTARLLASHRLVHTDDKPYACHYCDKRFRHESTRNTHHRTHTGEKPYVCSVCGKTFIQNSNLRLHMRTHTGEKPYSCDKCDKKFSSGSSLKSHNRTHTGEKPYSCKICTKRFARKVLSAHMRQHTGERPHACTVCPKKFVTAARLRDHRRIHTGEKPYECAICAKTFPIKANLVKHLKKHEPKKKPDKKEIVLVQHANYGRPLLLANNDFISDSKRKEETKKNHKNEPSCNKVSEDVQLDIAHDVPLEVKSELVVVQNEAEVLVLDNSNNDNGNVYLSTGNESHASDVNLVALNDNGLSLSASNTLMEGTTVKLYQLDQSLVQIQSSCVTISKITSKMTANY